MDSAISEFLQNTSQPDQEPGSSSEEEKSSCHDDKSPQIPSPFAHYPVIKQRPVAHRPLFTHRPVATHFPVVAQPTTPERPTTPVHPATPQPTTPRPTTPEQPTTPKQRPHVSSDMEMESSPELLDPAKLVTRAFPYLLESERSHLVDNSLKPWLKYFGDGNFVNQLIEDELDSTSETSVLRNLLHTPGLRSRRRESEWITPKSKRSKHDDERCSGEMESRATGVKPVLYDTGLVAGVGSPSRLDGRVSGERGSRATGVKPVLYDTGLVAGVGTPSYLGECFMKWIYYRMTETKIPSKSILNQQFYVWKKNPKKYIDGLEDLLEKFYRTDDGMSVRIHDLSLESLINCAVPVSKESVCPRCGPDAIKFDPFFYDHADFTLLPFELRELIGKKLEYQKSPRFERYLKFCLDDCEPTQDLQHTDDENVVEEMDKMSEKVDSMKEVIDEASHIIANNKHEYELLSTRIDENGTQIDGTDSMVKDNQTNINENENRIERLEAAFQNFKNVLFEQTVINMKVNNVCKKMCNDINSNSKLQKELKYRLEEVKSEVQTLQAKIDLNKTELSNTHQECLNETREKINRLEDNVVNLIASDSEMKRNFIEAVSNIEAVQNSVLNFSNAADMQIGAMNEDVETLKNAQTEIQRSVGSNRGMIEMINLVVLDKIRK